MEITYSEVVHCSYIFSERLNQYLSLFLKVVFCSLGQISDVPRQTDTGLNPSSSSSVAAPQSSSSSSSSSPLHCASSSQGNHVCIGTERRGILHQGYLTRRGGELVN